MTPSHADIAVVGGGPVGLAVAIEGALAGLDVVVFEQREGAIDKACGEGLMPGALAALSRWGVDPPGAEIAGFRYSNGVRAVEHRFDGTPGRGVRRTELHAALSARADALGVRTVRSVVREVDDRGGSVAVGGCVARLAVAADGLHSRLRTTAGLEGTDRGVRRYGQRRHFRIVPWTDLVEVHWLKTAEVYVTPVAFDTVGVAVLGARGTGFAESIAAVPELDRRLRLAGPVDSLRGAGPLRQRTTGVVSGRLALVGDAAGYVDALTGEGLAVGFASAREVVSAFLAGDLAGYERRWRRSTRVPRLITEGVLRLATSRLRPAVVPIAATVPGLFGLAIDLLARPSS